LTDEDFLELHARVEAAIEEFFAGEQECDCATCITSPVMETVAQFLDETFLVL
jgi:hypothetical protein